MTESVATDMTESVATDITESVATDITESVATDVTESVVATDMTNTNHLRQVRLVGRRRKRERKCH
jgi:hypothetical protein